MKLDDGIRTRESRWIYACEDAISLSIERIVRTSRRNLIADFGNAINKYALELYYAMHELMITENNQTRSVHDSWI